MKYKRIFLIVMDSLGIGEGIDAKKFDDFGTNTFKHISEKFPNGLNIPNLNYLGIADLDDIKGSSIVKHPHSFSIRLNESSNGKDTMTGHWEMMGILTTKPFQTFTDTGFPKELISELEKETGHKLIGNYASSGTEILKKLGEESMKTNSLIIYTSSDSVLQLCGHEETMGLNELYRCCEIARKLTMRPEWFVGRVIARPFIGTNKDNFKRTSNRHDYTISPTGITTMEILKENHYDVKCVGKINDIFNGYGVTSTVHTISNQDGVDKTIEIAKSENFKKGLCFVNLVEFDSEYGLRVEMENGEYMDCNRLSIGTIDQLYLSLRLAMVNDISKESMPIMLDETFAYFDNSRLENVLNFLAQELKEHQSIIFTCTNREKEILDKLKVEYNLIKL